jgi:Domain of unknown function (DUF397)
MDLYGVAWRKSRYSDQQGNCVEVGVWRKSSRSAQGGNCVEVAAPAPGRIVVRDSTELNGPVLAFEPGQWRRFAAGLKAGRLG